MLRCFTQFKGTLKENLIDSHFTVFTCIKGHYFKLLVLFLTHVILNVFIRDYLVTHSSTNHSALNFQLSLVCVLCLVVTRVNLVDPFYLFMFFKDCIVYNYTKIYQHKIQRNHKQKKIVTLYTPS